jgi:alpha-L-fucosidase
MKYPLQILAVAVLAVSSIAVCNCQADDAALAAQLRNIDQSIAEGPFKPEWHSLAQHEDPDWFRDAKFGIYTHWGPVTVGAEDGPAGGQWYGHSMYDTNSPTFRYHQQRFGDQHTVGYKDIIPKFTAERFNPDDWADLFAKAGAKFAGPVAVHHDNFAMWDSQLTRWNSKNMGPHRDITGELEKAIRAHGMKFITTFHHGFAWRYFEPSFAYDGADPLNADLYTEVHAPKAPPSKHFQDTWLAMVDEVLNKYQPDLIWFDFEFFAVITPEYEQKLFATTYDWAAQNNRTIGVCQKSRDIHQYTSILDFERGREDRLTPYPWLTDSAAGEWFHQKSAPYKSVDTLVGMLVDIVSKNGCLLLDVGPAADGTIPPVARERLLGLGDWLRVNGEAIYGTRPWKIYGEGPTKQAKAGGFSENADKAFIAQDIRFTAKNDALYAITLALPKAVVTIESLGLAAGKIKSIVLLGSEAQLAWAQDDKALTIQPVEKWPCQHAVAFKIIFQK